MCLKHVQSIELMCPGLKGYGIRPQLSLREQDMSVGRQQLMGMRDNTLPWFNSSYEEQIQLALQAKWMPLQ